MTDFDPGIEEDDEPSAPFWMATFSDMMTLLLTFFVMIVAMSEVEVRKFEEALSYFRGQRGVLEAEAAVAAPVRSEISVQAMRTRAERSEEVMRVLLLHDLEDAVQVSLESEGLHLTLQDSVLFDSGEATLRPVARIVLGLVAETLSDQVEAVRVEGHTDDRPIRTARFPSNWELSTARAASVVRFLLERPGALPADRHTAAGYAEHRPIASNETPSGRALNRRVELYFHWKPWPNEPLPLLMPMPPPGENDS